MCFEILHITAIECCYNPNIARIHVHTAIFVHPHFTAHFRNVRKNGRQNVPNALSPQKCTRYSRRLVVNVPSIRVIVPSMGSNRPEYTNCTNLTDLTSWTGILGHVVVGSAQQPPSLMSLLSSSVPCRTEIHSITSSPISRIFFTSSSLSREPSSKAFCIPGPKEMAVGPRPLYIATSSLGFHPDRHHKRLLLW